jgi:hypothetical protein
VILWLVALGLVAFAIGAVSVVCGFLADQAGGPEGIILVPLGAGVAALGLAVLVAGVFPD